MRPLLTCTVLDPTGKKTHRLDPRIKAIGSPKNKVGNSGKFSTTKKRPSTHHLLPRIHHKLTTKTPRKNTTISQNPL
jgi:hypothetical protein